MVNFCFSISTLLRRIGLSMPLKAIFSSYLQSQINIGLWSVNVFKVISTSVAVSKITCKFCFRNTVVQ